MHEPQTVVQAFHRIRSIAKDIHEVTIVPDPADDEPHALVRCDGRPSPGRRWESTQPWAEIARVRNRSARRERHAVEYGPPDVTVKIPLSPEDVRVLREKRAMLAPIAGTENVEWREDD